RCAVAEDGAHAGRLEEFSCEALAARAAEDAAGGEIDEIAVAARAVTGEGFAQLLSAHPPEHRRHRRRTAVKGEVVDRRVEELLLAPHHAARAAEVIRDTFARLDEAV